MEARRTLSRLLLAALACLVTPLAAAPPPPRPRPAPQGARRPRPPGIYVELRTGLGSIVVRMLAEEAPQTVANFVGLAEGTKPFRDLNGKMVKRPFYDGLTFHRVLPGVLIQAGCPKGDGTGGPGYRIRDEAFARRPYTRGAVLMSRRKEPNSAGSQFFILLADVRSHLPPRYVVFGEVVQGMDVADRIGAGEVAPNRFQPGERSTPVRPVVIERAVISRVPKPASAR